MSSNRTVAFSADLEHIGVSLAEQHGYHTLGAFLRGTVRKLAMGQRDHSLTSFFSTLPVDEQEAIDAYIRADFERPGDKTRQPCGRRTSDTGGCTLCADAACLCSGKVETA